MGTRCGEVCGSRHTAHRGPWAGILVLGGVLAAGAGCGDNQGRPDAGTDGDVQVEADMDTEPDAGDFAEDAPPDTGEDVPGDESDAAEEDGPSDNVAPQLLAATSENNTSVSLTFSEALADDADNRAHFVIDPALRIEDAVFSDAQDVLVLTTEPQTNLVTYTVRVLREDWNGDGLVDADDGILTDVAGNPVDPDFDSAVFVGISSMVYAIVDVMVSDNAAAVPPDYTGVHWLACTEPFVPDEIGSPIPGFDVNYGIGGTTTTINVKYELVPTTTSELVVTGISAQYWEHFNIWEPWCPEGWEFANGISGGLQGGLTTWTDGDCAHIGLCMRRQPLSEARTTGFISNLYFRWTNYEAYDCPAQCSSNGVSWPMIVDLLNIHLGCGDGLFLRICHNSATTDP